MSKWTEKSLIDGLTNVSRPATFSLLVFMKLNTTFSLG